MCVCERERGEIGVEEEGKGIQFWLIFKKYTLVEMANTFVGFAISENNFCNN